MATVITQYDEALASRTESLRRFRDETLSIDLNIDEQFQEMLRQSQALLEQSDREMADALSVSRPTINRWTNGKNLPYLAMRKPIRTWIVEQLTGKIKKLETLARLSSGISDRKMSSAAYAALAVKTRA